MHSFLYRESDPATHIYIVKEGEFKVTIRMNLPNQKMNIEANEVYKNPLKVMQGANRYFIKNTTKTFEVVDL